MVLTDFSTITCTCLIYIFTVVIYGLICVLKYRFVKSAQRALKRMI